MKKVINSSKKIEYYIFMYNIENVQRSDQFKAFSIYY